MVSGDACGHVFTSRVTAMGATGRFLLDRHGKNGIAERLIGTPRRECLGHMGIFGETHLRRILAAYASPARTAD